MVTAKLEQLMTEVITELRDKGEIVRADHPTAKGAKWDGFRYTNLSADCVARHPKIRKYGIYSGNHNNPKWEKFNELAKHILSNKLERALQ